MVSLPSFLQVTNCLLTQYIMTDLDYWRTRCELAEECLEQTPCDNDITRKQIEANNAYISFIANNDAPLNYQVIGTAEMVQNQPTGNL